MLNCLKPHSKSITSRNWISFQSYPQQSTLKCWFSTTFFKSLNQLLFYEFTKLRFIRTFANKFLMCIYSFMVNRIQNTNKNLNFGIKYETLIIRITKNHTDADAFKMDENLHIRNWNEQNKRNFSIQKCKMEICYHWNGVWLKMFYVPVWVSA